MRKIHIFCFLIHLLVGSTFGTLKAICSFTESDTIKGTIFFTEEPGKDVILTGQITGLPKGLHGFHVHQYGDLSNGCASTGGHFNPFGKVHGGKYAAIRHVGDLGNIDVDSSGNYNLNMEDNFVSLSGENSVFGRAVVIHAKGDDMGRGGNEGSLKTGNAGSRLACCIISVTKV